MPLAGQPVAVDAGTLSKIVFVTLVAAPSSQVHAGELTEMANAGFPPGCVTCGCRVRWVKYRSPSCHTARRRRRAVARPAGPCPRKNPTEALGSDAEGVRPAPRINGPRTGRDCGFGRLVDRSCAASCRFELMLAMCLRVVDKPRL